MGLWQVGPDVLARSRFAVSPLAETVGALAVLGGRKEAGDGMAAWAREHRPVFRARFGGDPFAAAFVEAAFRPRWIADFLSRPPLEGPPSFEREIDRVRRTPGEAALADLATALGAPPPTPLAVPDVAERAAALLIWVWTRTVEPDWPRRRRVFEADIAARTHRLGSHGWAAVIGELRVETSWLGDGRLRINAQDRPTREIGDADLLFVPTTSRRGWVSWDLPDRYALVYSCTGLLAGPDGAAVPGPLGRLLGPTRAGVLVRLDTPKSTSQLVALTGCGLGTVGGHLRVLLDAGLLVRHRSGRSVLYSRTPDGDRLVRAAGE
ncbi:MULTISPECIES: ArsR/SmtB family transcription factor [Thermomonosporaceae]|uniref:ArsR/SmtB family transcription factor n=1 Tax=Thermomonosporaceae TaxID=2012 RepID=UPI00255B22B7|nr:MULTISPECIES: transcriptional regulator [Thermomonosporaceae]MDL4775629.1 transcriptional regulator [Actinomadura xylanilytica]